MARFTANVKTTATSATSGVAIAAVWNPSTSKRIKVLEIHVFKQAVGAADEVVVRRITARGTATTTTTVAAVNETEQIAGPPSAWVLDGAYSAQPTFGSGELHAVIIPAAIGAGIMWSFADPIEVPAGQGLCLATGVALAFPVARITAIVED